MQCVEKLAACDAPLVTDIREEPGVVKCSELRGMKCLSEHDCNAHCVCPSGILDDYTGECVNPSNCSCKFNDRVFPVGETRMDSCNTCECENGQWQCGDEICPGEASAVGDPHYTTIDGRPFTFQGNCTYVLAKDGCFNTSKGSFRVEVKNTICGNGRQTCTKDTTVFIYNVKITLSKDKVIKVVDNPSNDFSSPPPNFRVIVQQGWPYHIVKSSIGLSVLWTPNNFVKVRVEKQFFGKVCGLAGNFDGNDNNDFQTSSGDIVTSVTEFGESWKVL